MASLTILVVDDHADSAEMLARVLRADGHFVVAAHDIGEALVVAARFDAIDVLVSDISLPDGDGCDLLRALNERRGGGPRFAIALTGHGEERWVEACRRAGFGKLLMKPVPFDALRAAIAALAPAQRPGPVAAPAKVRPTPRDPV